MDVQKLIGNGLNAGEIRELYLYKLPVLKTCNDWAQVKEVGKIFYKGRNATYDGGIVQYKNSHYYISNATMNALEKFRKWNFGTAIKVLAEKKSKVKTKFSDELIQKKKK